MEFVQLFELARCEVLFERGHLHARHGQGLPQVLLLQLHVDRLHVVHQHRADRVRLGAPSVDIHYLTLVPLFSPVHDLLFREPVEEDGVLALLQENPRRLRIELAILLLYWVLLHVRAIDCVTILRVPPSIIFILLLCIFVVLQDGV